MKKSEQSTCCSRRSSIAEWIRVGEELGVHPEGQVPRHGEHRREDATDLTR